MARVRRESGQETVTSEESDEDSITPKYSPISLSEDLLTSREDLTDCAECKFSSRRFPITCENDLYRVTPCKHESSHQSLTRNASAIPDGGWDNDWERRYHNHPPKLTDSLSHNGTGIIRPIAFKPTDGSTRFLPGTLRKALERHSSDNTLQREAEFHQTMEMSPFPSKNFSGIIPDAQRFGGSLSNVPCSSPSTEQVQIRRIGSAIQIDATGTSPHTRGIGMSLWENERKGIGIHENNLKTAEQRAIKLEQALATQSCQLQQERKKFRMQLEEAFRRSRQTERMNSALRQEVDALRAQLEEVEWAMDLLKTQLKNSHGDQTRNQELRSTLQQLATEATTARSKLAQCTLSYRSKERENMILRETLTREERSHKETVDENYTLRKRLKEMEMKHSAESAKWEAERLKWADEQQRVLRYQRALQHNYVIACEKSQDLSAQLEHFGVTGNTQTKIAPASTFSHQNQNGMRPHQSKEPLRS